MKLNYFTKLLSTMGRWLAMALLWVSAVTFVWQGGFLSDTAAMAAPATNSIASADLGNQVQDRASKDAGRAKNFIRDSANRVERTANRNADRVEQATDDRGSFLERKANRDTARIERRAEQDAARTQKAVDQSKNAIERAVDNIKDTFGN